MVLGCDRAMRVVLGAALVVLGGAVAGAAPAQVARARYLMGTRLSITIPAPAPEAPFEEAFAEVARLEEVMSNWTETSEMSRLNRAAAAAPFHCSPDLFDAVQVALHWAGETGGAFDPTVEPLVRALGLRGPDGWIPLAPGALPEDARRKRDGTGGRGSLLAEDVAPVGWRHVRLDPGSRSVAFDRTGVGIDLGGIGKGIALDAVARVLARHGVGAALLDFGGQVLALAAPPGERAWPVGIADPDRRDAAVAWVSVHDRSVSTSGDSERSVQGPSGSVGHILDPSLRGPAVYRGSVTLVASDATTADALSTGLFVMGPDRGCRWAEERDQAALFLWRGPDGHLERRATKEFERLAREGSDSRPEMERRAAGVP